ncbi:MAG: rod shape-determining protein, partial [Desulfovibrionaceae bacterium]|nr:rod shape-determining protein [Desulfovibrionaceae bacterium]
MFFWNRFLRLFARDIAMDLGTANTLLFTKKGGIVVNEPSVVDLDVRTGEVLSVGARAKSSRGRTPDRVRNVRPMREGVIADFDVTTRMIVHF